MAKAGFDAIDIAKQNGTWLLMDAVEELMMPEDLRMVLNRSGSAMDFFQSQSKSIMKMMLHWVVTAKRSETRTKRIAEIARSAAKGVRPDRFR